MDSHVSHCRSVYIYLLYTSASSSCTCNCSGWSRKGTIRLPGELIINNNLYKQSFHHSDQTYNHLFYNVLFSYYLNEHILSLSAVAYSRDQPPTSLF